MSSTQSITSFVSMCLAYFSIFLHFIKDFIDIYKYKNWTQSVYIVMLHQYPRLVEAWVDTNMFNQPHNGKFLFCMSQVKGKPRKVLIRLEINNE